VLDIQFNFPSATYQSPLTGERCLPLGLGRPYKVSVVPSMGKNVT
jgi:hypothetical protein